MYIYFLITCFLFCRVVVRFRLNVGTQKYQYKIKMHKYNIYYNGFIKNFKFLTMSIFAFVSAYCIFKCIYTSESADIQKTF